MSRSTTGSVFDHDPESLRAWVQERDLPRYLADQILQWVYRRGVTDPEAMTNVSRRARTLLEEEMAFGDAIPLDDRLATDGTRKLLLGWPDAAAPEEAPTALPFSRRPLATDRVRDDPQRGSTNRLHLEPGRMPRRLPVLRQRTRGPRGKPDARTDRRAGMEAREPRRSRSHHQRRLHGHGRTAGELRGGHRRRADPERRLGPRDLRPEDHGLDGRSPGGDQRFAGFEIPVTSPLSLHAPNDDLRREIIPWAEYSTVDELLDACREYFDSCGREITLEYILLGGVNDQPEHARQLAAHAATLRCNINLIRYNEVADLPFRRPESDDVHRFQAELRRRGANVHIRASRGRDIAAACGQLRHERRAGR